MERTEVRKKPALKALNAHLVCVLCGGYLVDASTLVDCMHTFCRGCLVRHLQTSKSCPICDQKLNKAKNSQLFRADTALQSLVYKLVPTIYQSELYQRRDFYAQPVLKEMAPSAASVCNYGLGNFFSPEDSISLSLQYYEDMDNAETKDEPIPHRRYLQCPAAVTMKHLKKFLRLKYGLSGDHLVDVIYNNECLSEDFTLMDVAYTFLWERASPMRFHYRIFQQPTFTKFIIPGTNTIRKHDSKSKSVSFKCSTSNCSSSPTDNSVPSHEHSMGTTNKESQSKKLRMGSASKEQVSCTTTSLEIPLNSLPPGINTAKNMKGETKTCIHTKNCEATPKTVTLKAQAKCTNASGNESEVIISDTDDEVSIVEHRVSSSLGETAWFSSDINKKVGVETKSHGNKAPEVEVDKAKNNLKRRASSDEDEDEDEGCSRNAKQEKKNKEEKEHTGRKKGKHKYKYLKSLDDKKRSIIVTPTILHNPDDLMKLKVKLNPVPVIPNSHHHKHHHSKHHHSKHHKSSLDSNSDLNNSFTTNKERLLQMRAVRHKTNKATKTEKSPEEIFQKQKASLLVPPSSITVSKVPSIDRRMADLEKLSGGSNGIENKRPSLEIMLVSSKKSSGAAAVQGKNEEGKKGSSETSGTKMTRPLPASIPLVRTSKQGVTPIKPPHGLTITPKITTKPEETSAKPHSALTKANSSLVKTKKQTENVSSSKAQDSKFREKESSPKLSEGTPKLPENGCKEHGMGVVPASVRHDNCGALDLSGKSSRKSDTSSPSPTLEAPLPTGTTVKSQSILAIAQNLAHKQLSSSRVSNGDKGVHVPVSSAAPSSGMSNLKTLSDAAVRIRNLMAAETKVPVPNNITVVNTNNHHKINNNVSANCLPTRNSLQFTNNNNRKVSPVGVQSSSPYPPGSTLRIPMPQASLKLPPGRGAAGRPSIPRLNEIVSKGRGGRGLIPLVGTKPGPNLGVRHIPNPSALFRQQSINKNINGKSSATDVVKTGCTSVPSSSLTVTAAPIRKIENMTRNIEKVAAGLTVRAVEANVAPKLT